MIRSAPILTVNPTTGERMDAYFPMGPAEVAEILRRADESCRGWKDAPFGARAVPMKELARRLREGAEDHARRMAIEMGKPILQGRSEVEKCAWACDYFAE